MFYLFLLQLAAPELFPEGYYTVSKLKSELDWISSQEGVSLIPIGRSVEGRPIPAVRINSSKEFSCLVLGGMHSNEHASVYQVMDIMKEVLKFKDSINANIWFVPLLNVDGGARIEEYINQGIGVLEISKNQRNTDCLSLAASGVDLNYNFPTLSGFPSFPKCHEHYQGSKPFSEPESECIQRLANSIHFHMIISYFSGSTTYVIPKSHSSQFAGLYSEVSKIADVQIKDQTGSLANWAADNGIFSISAYVSSTHRPQNFDFVQRNTRVFFNILAKIGSDFKYFATQEENSINVFIENQGFFQSNDAPLAVTCSVPIHEVIFKYNDQQEQINLDNLKEVSFVLKNILPLEHIVVILKLVPTDEPVDFKILINNKRVQSLDRTIDFAEHWTVNESGFVYARDPFYFGIASLCLVLFGFLIYSLLIHRLKEDPYPNRRLNIPKRPLPDDDPCTVNKN